MKDIIIVILIFLGLASFVQGYWKGYTFTEILFNSLIWFLLALAVFIFTKKKKK